MGFLEARSNLKFVTSFRAAVFQLWDYENSASKELKRDGFRSFSHRDVQSAIVATASRMDGYPQAREQVVKDVLRVSKIAQQHGVPYMFQSYPAPAVGGPVISVNIFQAILTDTSHVGFERRIIKDAIDQTIGACEDQLGIEVRRLLNPLYWVKELIVAIIRIPFLLIEASGFDTSKIEDHLFARLFKLLEIIALIYIALYIIGFTKEDLYQILIEFLTK